jgi:hypothetical protein
MITNDQQLVVETSTNLNVANFHIKNSAKAFQILSSNLYSDKITAIIRELSTNAFDSHVEAKNPNPFQIHIPNSFEPYFSIRDFGVGISHEGIMSIYTTYFDSTRSSSNEMVGMMGLGSKSPFSYVDTFTITSWYNGEKRNYIAFINENRIPSITLVSTEPTTEPNGLEIIIAVKPSDFSAFRSRIANIYTYFPIKPNILGSGEINCKSPEYFIQKENEWGLNIDNQYRTARAIMGNIAYPLNDIPDTSNYTKAALTILQLPIDIYFNIGELDIAASRESLSYDKTTCENIYKKINQVNLELQKYIENQLSTCTCLWDARLKAIELISNYSYLLRKYVENSLDIMIWQGQKLLELNHYNSYNHNILVPSDKTYIISIIAHNTYRRRQYNYNPCHKDTYIPISTGTHFFIRDTNISSQARCNLYFEKHPECKTMVFFDFIEPVTQNPTITADIENTSNNIDINTTPTIITEKEALSNFKKILGLPDSFEFIKFSSLPTPPPKERKYESQPYNPKYVSGILVWNGKSYNNHTSSSWGIEPINFSEESIYVNIERFEIKCILSNNVDEDVLKILKEVTTALNIPCPKIYGVKSKMLSKVRSLTNWKHLDVYLNEILTEYITKNDLINKYIIYKSLESYYPDYDSKTLFYHIKNNFSLFSVIKNNSKILEIFEIQKYSNLFAMEYIINKKSSITFTEIFVDPKYNATQIQKDIHQMLNNLITEISDKYPLLKYMEKYASGDKFEKGFIHYIELINEHITKIESEKEKEVLTTTNVSDSI